MNACDARHFSPEGVWNTALLPLEEPLRRELELAPKSAGELAEQIAMIVDWAGHAAFYQRCVDRSSVQSLMAAKTTLMQKARMTLGQRITAAYAGLGLTQAEAARRCGWSAQRFGQYASGKRTPDLESLVKMAEVFNTTPDQLLGVSAGAGSELIDILSRLLELEGLGPESARTIAEAAGAAQQVLKSLPDSPGDLERARLVAQAVWSARRLPRPDKPLDQ